MSKRQEKGSALRYVFLRIYSNDELQRFLTKLLREGLVIDHCRGNFLFFRRQQLKKARLCVVTTECSKPSAQEDEQVAEYIDIAQKQGWQLLCVGDYESLLPMRRRLYFYTCDSKVKPLEPDEAIDFQNAYRAYHSTAKWTAAWTLLAAAALVSTVLFMLADGLHPLLALLDTALLAVAAGAMMLCFDRKKLYDHVTKQKPFPADSDTALRRRERFMLGAMTAALAAMLLLLVV